MEIISAKDMIRKGEYHPKFFIMGDSGGGKTTALRTMPSEWRVLVLDCFGNKESLEGADNIDIVSYSEYDPKDPRVWMEIDSDKRQLVRQLEGGTFPYDALVIDTVTGFIRFCEMHVLHTNPDGKGIGGAAAMHHYRGISHMMGEFLVSFLSFPITVVINAHVEFAQDEDLKVFRYQPVMTGKKWRNTIYAYLGEVYRAFGEPSDQTDKHGNPTTDFFWQTQPDPQWPMLKSVMNTGQQYWGKYIEPNYEAILKRRGVIE